MCCTFVCYSDIQDGETALIMAAMEGHHKCISILIANGADPDMANKVKAKFGGRDAHDSPLELFVCLGSVVPVSLCLSL